MHHPLSRRALLGGAGTIAAASALPWDIAQAQTATGTLRVGMTAAAIPLSNGVPDQGAEGHRFMGITVYDQLCMWDLSSFDKPPVIRPGLATAWRTDPADPKRWIITLREGVKFHDGKVMTAEDVVFSFDRAFRNDAPHFDNRAAAQARIRMPTIASWRAEGENTFILETRTPDSLVPFGLTWIGITHRGAWEAAGRNWDTFLNRAIGTGPYRLETFSIRERAVLVRNPDYWETARIPKHERLVCCCRCPRRTPASPRCARTKWTSSKRRRPMPCLRCARPASRSSPTPTRTPGPGISA